MATTDVFNRSISPRDIPDKPLRSKPNVLHDKIIKSPGFGSQLNFAESFQNQNAPLTRNNLHSNDFNHGTDGSDVEDVLDADHIILTDTDVSVASVTPRMQPVSNQSGAPLVTNGSLQVSDKLTHISKPKPI